MNIVSSILLANRGRDPQLLALKWAKMKTSAFAFFRGTAPLFHREWSREKLPGAPRVWICGDAHTENVGSYKGDDRIPYFDLNDFDEACLAPAHYDLGRALAALYLLKKPKHARMFLESYRQALLAGKPRHIEPEVAHGPIAALLAQVKERTREEFLAARVIGGKLRIRPNRSYPLDPQTKRRVRAIFEEWARAQHDPKIYQVKDICGRIAGTGSLGLERYTLLVRGKKAPLIMDMKEACPSAVLPFYRGSQPKWTNEAQRVSRVQYFMQYVSIARLSWTAIGSKSFILRELQPVEDRIDISKLTEKDYDQFVITWAKLLASAHIRSGGWRGSATLEELMKYGEALTPSVEKRLLTSAARVAKKQFRDYREFSKWPTEHTED